MITLQFVCTTSLQSQAIAWFSAGHVSHVDAVVDGQLLGARDNAVGGKPPGVWIRPPDYEAFSNRVVMHVPCSQEQHDAFYTFLRAQIGKPYDQLAILAFAFNRDWRKPDSWICSELQSAAGEAAGILKPLYLAAHKITPVACALAYSAVGGTVAS